MSAPESSLVPSLVSRLARDSGRTLWKKLETARYYTGIDLGTTNSSVAVVDALALLRGDTDTAVRVLPIRQRTARGVVESPYLASVVAEVEPGEWWVGQGAREARSRGLLHERQIFCSTKLEMGLGREPFYRHADSQEYDSPYKVAGRILKELRQAVEDEAGEETLGSVVVTVPASFQLAARKDTFRAARLAGIELREQCLLDEPNAAFLDYILTCRHRTQAGQPFDLSRPRNVLVFDFGGGTCDVSILRVHADPLTQRLDLANLSIARYEQLGGDNIDAAIVERVLMPQLLKQNNLGRLDLSWSETRERILPQFRGAAETLKLGLCGVSAPALPHAIAVQLPPREGRALRLCTLARPSMTSTEFEKVLEPFLDPDLLYARDSELTPVTSIFAPVTNALQGAGLKPENVDALLLVGGSSLIPQVEKALVSYFPRAERLGLPDHERALTSVARGAALQSFFLHALGRPVINPIAQESLGIVTEGGFVELVPRGVELPFPKEGGAVSYGDLVVPRDFMKEVQIVIAAGGPDKPLGVERLEVPLVRSGGEPIDLSVRLDASKLLTVRARLTNHPDAHCTVTLENPLCAVAFGSEHQKEIAELENDLAGRPHTSPLEREKRERLAWLYQYEGKPERGIEEARKAMEADRQPNAWLLNIIGGCYELLGAPERAEKHLREAMRIAPDPVGARFNLSLFLSRRGRIAEAAALMDESLELEPDAAVERGWRGMLWRGLGRRSEGDAEIRRAAAELDAEPSLDRWQRHWRGRFAEKLGDAATQARLERERMAERAADAVRPYDEARLPGHVGTLAKRVS